MKRYCNEECDHCIYVGEGGFLCDITEKIVIEDFIPTKYYRNNCKLKEKEWISD